ncbi:MAG: NAD(P)H-hydrate dehydratase [Microbacteriaceae bacterium]|nr:NAD(P)H-hydrate dehydratase [Burkholderiaceae bacterium]
MQKLFPAHHSAPLFNVASSRLIEAAASGEGLMERAGLAVAKLALAVSGEGTIWVVCGAGNNGGDGLVAARLLHLNGRRVRVSLMAGLQPADAQAALQTAQEAGVAIGSEIEAPPATALVIDALLGLGLNRAPSAAIATAITQLNALAAPMLAIDLPSGLLADTGALAGAEAVRASHTIALLTLKPGLFTAQGRAQCGTLWFDDLGVRPQQAAGAVLLGADCLAALAPRSAASHKGSFGDVLVLGGAPGLRGAALLAARAALAAGAGRAYACLLDAAQAAEVDGARPELMGWPQARLADAVAWREKTLVVGCGGGDAVAALLPTVLAEAKRLVLDADGLNAVAADAALRTRLVARAARGLATVLTPHPLEAARLLECSSADIQSDRLSAAQALADQFGSTVILKGSGSVIASPGSTTAINPSGSAALATAGTGDVLAGWLGGLWAQQPLTTPHALACAATFWHGMAGETQAPGPLRAADRVERMLAPPGHS